MKETRKQKEIRLRRRAVWAAYCVTELSTTDFVDGLAKKLKLSSVTVYADLKFMRQSDFEADKLENKPNLPN